MEGQPYCKVCAEKMRLHCWRRTGGGWCGWWRCDAGCGLICDEKGTRWIAERANVLLEHREKPPR